VLSQTQGRELAANQATFFHAPSRPGIAKRPAIGESYQNPGSITSTESFLGRAQLSEGTHIQLWILVLAAMLTLTITRRVVHGSVMSSDAIYYTYTGLGVAQGERYGSAIQVRRDEGGVLVMLTDGFFEWSRGDGQAFGIPRLEETLRGAACADAAGILRANDGAVQGFCDGSPQADDMTAIVVKRTSGMRMAS